MESHHGVIDNMQDCDIVVSMLLCSLPYPSPTVNYGLDSTTTVVLQGWFNN